ncbi:HesA/MoeB/ThiF family protein [Streptomyces sp. NPDC048248]|uniref:HesA/MoeB/ThiF family protein n=1 Tax=Streptomyces sp. NPDC048248 TaxID=3365523 RepID=UPI003718EF8C
MTATLDAFYEEFTERNRGFISERAQSALREARVLIAGCGSTGGAAAEPLARIGVEDFVLVDVGEFELNNLNRQHATFGDIGRHKAEVAEERVRAINPHARTEVITGGITSVNARDLTETCTLVIDGVDVTEHAGWRAKYHLHEAAARAMRPVLSGYDMAGTQYIRFYDYRRPGSRPFDGKITAGMVEESAVWSLLLKALPLRFVPLEMIRNAREHLGEEEYSVPQLVYASLLFGALATRMTVEILAGQPVRRHVVVDAHSEARRTTRRWATRVQRALILAGGLRALATVMRNRQTHTKKQGAHC